ncbi:MAG: hypothetical protein P9X26_08305 [Candidatus Stygibacter frigidus]|nr:hypothetical protein [Candidatus Stygibacter frigidus]
MNWIKAIFNGVIAWLMPFIFNEFIFPELPSGFKFILYLLAGSIAFIDYSNNLMNGYLQKRNKVTVSVGIVIGIIWFLINFTLSGIYFVAYNGQLLLEYAINIGSIFLIYPILGVVIGVCEEKRGRRR